MGNIELAIKRDDNAELLFKEFAVVLKNLNHDKNVCGMFAYGDFDKGNFGLQSNLICNGIEPKQVVTKSSFGVIQGAVDMELALDMMQCLYENPHITDFMVVSGDGDFIPAFKRLRLKGKYLHVASFLDKTSNRLIDMVDTYTDLSEYKSEFINQPTMTEIERKQAAALRNEWIQKVIYELTTCADSSMNFVGLNFFRAKLLNKYDYSSLITEALAEALELGIIERYSVPNPKNVSRPTTACRLNIKANSLSMFNNREQNKFTLLEGK